MTSAQLKNAFSAIGELDASLQPSSLQLKISVDFSGIRYFVYTKTHQQIVFFGQYTLHHIASEAELSERIQRIVEKDDVLQLNFAEVLIGVDTTYSLLPAELSFMKDPESHADACVHNTMLLLHSPTPLLEQTLRSLFQNTTLIHLNASLIRYLAALERTDAPLYVQVSANHLDVIYFKPDGTLQIMNRYAYKTASDFIYFVLLVAEEIGFERETTPLILLGEIDIQSKVYDLCYRYFRHIEFIEKPEPMQFAKAFDLYPKHLHFPLYTLHA
jgi:hypothetical protein